MVVAPFAPIVTNIANPNSVWVRLEGSVVIKAQTEVKPDVLAAQSAHQIMAYLRTLDLPQVQGASGLMHVTEDLNEIMKTFSDGAVRQVLISGFIVE
jgi:flagellar protein FliL